MPFVIRPAGIQSTMTKQLSILLLVCAVASVGAANPTLTIEAGQPIAKVSPTLYGLMTEEINHSYDGGLYGELIQNRAFLDNPNTSMHWTVVQDKRSAATMALDPSQPLNDALPVSLRVEVSKASKRHPAGIANDGYWGIPVQPAMTWAIVWASTETCNNGVSP